MPLAVAIAEDKYEVAKALMEGGADVNAPAGADGLTPLMIAVAQNAPAEGAMLPAVEHAAARNRQGSLSSAAPM